MGIQINGNTDTISASDGSLVVTGAELQSSSATTLSVGIGGTAITTTDAGLVGIGTTNPGSKLNVWGPVTIGTNNPVDMNGVNTLLKIVNDNQSLSGAGAVINELYGDGTSQPGYVARFARGTEASPSQVLANDRLAFLVGGGFGTSTFNHSSSIDIFAQEDYTESARGSYIRFTTTNSGEVGRTEKVRITGSGNVGIGASIPGTRLEVRKDTASTFYDTTIDTTLLLSGTPGSGEGNYGGSIGFSRLDSTGRINAAIAIRQTSADADQCGLSFFTHPSSNTGSSLAEVVSIKHNGNIVLNKNTSVSNLENTNIGVAAGIASTAFQVFFNNGNGGYVRVKVQRNETGGDWTTSSTKLLHVIDVSEQAFVEYNPRGGLFGMAFGQGNNEWARFEANGGKLMIGIQTARAAFFNSTATSKFHVEGAGDFPDRAVSQVFGSNDANGPIHILAKHRAGIGGTALVVQDDQLGLINFQGADGSEFVEAAYIGAFSDGIAGINSMPGRIVFATTPVLGTTPSEKMRITSNGYTKISSYGGYINAYGAYHEILQHNNEVGLYVYATNNVDYAFTPLVSLCGRPNNAAYSLFSGYSSGLSDREYDLRGDGNAFADGTWTGGGADYAEYFEWSDGNLEEEDRRGISVVLDGDKIREAQDGEDPIGVISGNPSVVGDGAWNKWNGKYLRDDFGTYIREPHQVVEWEEEVLEEEEVLPVYDENDEIITPGRPAKYKTVKQSYEDFNIPEDVVIPVDAVYKSVDENGNPFTHRKLNPDYDPDMEYIPREQRPEWDCVGLMGKLRIRKGQVIGSRWIKMRDVSDSVEEWLVR